MAQGYKGCKQIAQQANKRLREMKTAMEKQLEKILPENNESKPRHLFSETIEIPRSEIEVRPEIFQGRDTKYAEETVEKIVREGFDKSREPIIVWRADDGKYVVISGHSRWEASERLYRAGDTSLAKMPVKIFLGDFNEAMDYALLESSRSITQEGLKADLRAYKRAREKGYNKDYLKGIFKPEARLRLLEDISFLNEKGSFITHLDTPAEKSFPYLQRNAQWAGNIREQYPQLTDAHEEELFRYLYGVNEESASAGKKKITITKDQFFDLINKKVSRIDFNPTHALNLDERVSTSALTDPAKERIREIQEEINKLVEEREKKDELIVRAMQEGKQELVEKFKNRQSEINQLITNKLLEKQKTESEIGKTERTAFDLFSAAEEPLPAEKQENMEEKEYVGYNDITDAEYAWQMYPLEYQLIKAIEKTGSPHVLDTKDRREHEKIVEWALKQGKPVPEEVLEDYPHLKELKQAETPEKRAIRENALDLLIGDKWFKDNPGKILGEEYQTTDRFNRPVTKVKGTMENVIQGIDIPSSLLPEEQPAILETEIKPSIEQLLTDEASKKNILKVVHETKKKQSERALKELYGEKEEPEKPYYSFEDIMQEYNKGISEEEIKAWIWYKRKIQSYNDETVLLNAKNGWSRYIIPLGQITPHLNRWLKEGIMCYEGGDYIPAVLYYAENIYKRQAQLIKDRDTIVRTFGDEQYERQWNGLEQIKPPRLSLTDPIIENRLFINPASDFVRNISVKRLTDGTVYETFGKKESEGKTLIDAFKDWLKTVPAEEFEKSNFYEITNYYLDNKQLPKHHDNEQKLRIRQNAKAEGDKFFAEFMDKALTREDQLRVEHLWNSIYNGYVEPNYFKIPVAFTCSSTFKNKPLFIRAVQREALGFMTVHGSGCIAYDVGLGKTMTAILALAQAMQSGICKRPFIVVPNQTYQNWLNEIRGVVEKGAVQLTGLIPQYEVLDLYNLGTDYIEQLQDKKGNIKRVPEYTISVLTYEGFNRLGFNKNTWGVIGNELYGILNQGKEKAREEQRLWQRIEEMMGKGIRGGLINIEDLGFDYMVVDEAHSMKKSFTQVKGEMQESGNRKRSHYKLSAGEPSMIALRGFMIAQYILRQNQMRNVMLLTATPFTNSPLEIYSILALIGYQQLERGGIKNIRQFFETFIKTSYELIINAKLKPERKEVVLGFNNLVGLQQLLFRFIIYKTGEDANIQRPNKIVLPLINQNVNGQLVPLPEKEQISTNLPMNFTQKTFMKDVEAYVLGGISLDNFCINPAGLEDTEEGNEGTSAEELDEENLDQEEKDSARVLRGLAFARQLALSPYLYSCNPDKEPTYESYIETSPKLTYVMKCIQSVRDYCREHGLEMPGQVIYMNAGVAYFPFIKDYLVKKTGFREDEVGIIRSGISAAKKEGVKEQFNAGKIKVLIGSASIKEGINLQSRTTDLYDCWPDWNPTDLKQLAGRVWRFGNIYANVRFTIPLMEDTINIFEFQKLQEKTSRINEIWYRAGRANTLKLEEVNPNEIKMGLITDPKALARLIIHEEKEKVADEISNLKNQKAVLDEIRKARDTYNENAPELYKIADKYKPREKGTGKRALETILKIAKEYIEDETTKYLEQQRTEKIYDNVRSSNSILKRGLEQVLAPKGFDLTFDYKKVIRRLDADIEEYERELKENYGEEAVEAKAEEIIIDRAKKGYKVKTVDERVKEFERLNPKVLTEMAVHDERPETRERQQSQIQKGQDLIDASDTIEEMEALVRDMEEMENLLREMENLQTA